MTIKAVLFDMDGTLVDSPLDFERIREDIGITRPQPILEYLDTLDEDARARGHAILDQHEHCAACEAKLIDGAADLLDFIRASGLKIALVTRNSRRAVDTVLATHALTFDAIVSREDAAIKPSKEPLVLACSRMGVELKDTIFVGDYEFDRQSGQAAGIPTYILSRTGKIEKDDEILSLRDVIEILQSSLDADG